MEHHRTVVPPNHVTGEASQTARPSFCGFVFLLRRSSFYLLLILVAFLLRRHLDLARALVFTYYLVSISWLFRSSICLSDLVSICHLVHRIWGKMVL
ncbi:hypothetical protein K1719_012006 [Acacia pycnantha]|nr:hypothetical protein K1719_012006 [Acacia pycnantha]